MLTHFKNFNFSSLLKYFNNTHFFFLYYFYCHLLSCSFMSRQFNLTKLAFAKSISENVEVQEVLVADDFLELVEAILVVFLMLKIQYS